MENQVVKTKNFGGIEVPEYSAPNWRFYENAPFGRLFDWQQKWWEAWDGTDDQGQPHPPGRARFTIAEIHRRGRKSSTFLNFQIRECLRLPRTRHNIIGPTFEETRRIYWDDPTMLRAALPGKEGVDYKLNEQRMIVKFPKSGSVQQFYGGDDPENLRGIDGQSFVFDEWSQQKLECWTKIVQPIVEQYPERWVAFIYTPCGINHATQMFDHAACVDQGYPLPVRGPAQKMLQDWYAVRLAACSYNQEGGLLLESGIYSLDSLERIRSSPDTTREIFEQEYMCARVMDEQFTLITTAMLEALDRDPPMGNGSSAHGIIACDPAMGGDECSIDVHLGPKVLERVSVRTKDWNLIVAKLRELSDSHRIYDFIVDEIGIGQAAIVLLEQDERYRVIHFNSSEASVDPKRFKNKRTDMWWSAMQEVRAFGCQYPPDDETRRQIPFASRYKADKVVQIVSKDDIRKLLGRSPDRADSWAMARYGLPMARQATGPYMQFREVRSSDGPVVLRATDLFRRNRFYEARRR